ncbi:hypothetical protein AVEN_216825-1 [Araneus ventricosus]|uniref:Uncharacterized protein n=1 Tax=Araneus ventricosus TaxID=182803 RepID=A0A4Y2JHA6_ARAVE|nr:hypothetical protein AVEN_216825-1 [Araneus ventricosus]
MEKSKLSTVGKSFKFVKVKDLLKRQVNQLILKNDSFLSGVLKVSEEMGIIDTILTKYYREINPEEELSIHQLLLDFFQLQQQDSKTVSVFLQYCSQQMSEAACDEALRKAKSQHTKASYGMLCVMDASHHSIKSIRQCSMPNDAWFFE